MTSFTSSAPPDGARAQRLAAARLYLCTDARERQGDLEQFLDAALAGGIDIVQLRQKGLEAAQEIAYLEVFTAVAARHGALVAVNDRADIARTVGSDILHVGQDDLPLPAARAIAGEGTLLGLSTHTRAQVDDALARPGPDYFCVGPTWPTPTKPGRPAPGLELTRYAAGRALAASSLATAASRPSTPPWFAIGGIDLATLDQVLEAGARRVVVVRAITAASDPGAAAAEIVRRLRDGPTDGD